MLYMKNIDAFKVMNMHNMSFSEIAAHFPDIVIAILYLYI